MGRGLRVVDQYGDNPATPCFGVAAFVALAAAAALRFVNRAATLFAWPANLAHTLGPEARVAVIGYLRSRTLTMRETGARCKMFATNPPGDP